MKIRFKAKTNRPYCIAQKARFTTKNGSVVVIGQESEEYSIKNGNLDMTWKSCYVSSMDGKKCGQVFPDTVMVCILEGANFESFENDDPEDPGQRITDVSWTLA